MGEDSGCGGESKAAGLVTLNSAPGTCFIPLLPQDKSERREGTGRWWEAKPITALGRDPSPANLYSCLNKCSAIALGSSRSSKSGSPFNVLLTGGAFRPKAALGRRRTQQNAHAAAAATAAADRVCGLQTS